ncbi:DUF3237 domain-containing protein [Methylocapsa sp. S129]|uniref:DUF3237 domain-containing protein n=1 Tax=Methylocapsa sp. S129 TaxID=1641869 RepID=UPI00131DDF34|nr:DUF3237 domain-containing protein [Methylocapsa sp. S129]
MIEASLRHIADLSVKVAPPIVVGHTPAGLRRIVPIIGGAVSGPRLKGEVIAAGADYQLIGDDGFTLVEARYAFRTHDGATIGVDNVGLRHGPPEAMARLARGEAVDPALIYFRTRLTFETDHADYLWLTRSLFVGAGARHPAHVEINVFEVL